MTQASVIPAIGCKCRRCGVINEEVGLQNYAVDLCARCADAVEFRDKDLGVDPSGFKSPVRPTDFVESVPGFFSFGNRNGYDFYEVAKSPTERTEASKRYWTT